MGERTDERRFDLAIAGELNLDLILYGLPALMSTERELLGTGFTATLGSSSAIVAHNAAALGARVLFATVIGGDELGRTARGRLEEAGVDTSGVVVEEALTTGVSIHLPHGDERHILTYPGSMAALTVGHLDYTRLCEARHFHLSSLYLQRGLHAGLVEMVRGLRAAGVTISLDTNDDPEDGWGAPLAELLPLVDFFLPNEDELCRMSGTMGIEEAVRVMGPKVRTMVVKRGRAGCRVVRGGVSTDVAGIAVMPVDTIGAGDSFDAGFLWAFLAGRDVLDCAFVGNVTGALSTQGCGGTEAFRDAGMRRDFLARHLGDAKSVCTPAGGRPV